MEKRIENAGRGFVFTCKEFQDITSSGSIGQILSRLVKEGMMRRIGRGLFDYPKVNPALGGELSPDLYLATKAIARKSRWAILPFGDLAANRLGLSQQVPAKHICLSNGPTKQIKVGNRTIHFKHARPKEIYIDSEISGLVVPALRYIGKDNVNKDVVAHLKNNLSHKEKKELLEHIHYSTGWIYEIIQQIAKEKTMTGIEKQISYLFTTELQFRLASAVRPATTKKGQPLDLPIEWSHGQNSVKYEEIALREDQADYASCFLQRSATYLMAVAIQKVLEAVVDRPQKADDKNMKSAYWIARLIRNASAHDPIIPTWKIDRNQKNKGFSVPNVIVLNTSSLHGKQLGWRHYGGPLALFRLCQYIRYEVLKDKKRHRNYIPIPQNYVYQQGNLILTKINEKQAESKK
jgi:hypothetical protein